MKFIYLDECKDTEYTKIVSLTGVVVDSEKYQSLRSNFYKILHRYISPEGNTIDKNVPELHGANLLQGIANDEEKFRVLKEIVTYILDSNARVYRVGYYATPKMMEIHKNADGMLSICLFGIKTVCQPEYENHMVIPVMDSVNEPVFKQFSRSIRNLDIMRSTGLADEDFSIKNTNNLCEMHFADSAHSAFIQMADLVSYLLHTKDFEICQLNRTEFKKKIISIANELEPAVIRNEVVEMKFNT